MFTRSIVIQRRVEDFQLGVESYQKKLNITKPDTYISDLRRREQYTAYSSPKGFIYQNKDKKNILMRLDELHKFSDGTLDDVRTALDDRLKGIRMEYSIPRQSGGHSDREHSLNSAAGGNFLDKMPRECLRIIESKSKVRNSRNKAVVAKKADKQFAHAISIIDFSKDEPFSGSTTIHFDALPPSSSPVKTSDNLEEFADELTLLDSFPPDGWRDDETEQSNVSNSDSSFLNKPLSDKVECSDPEVDIDEIDAFLAMEVSSNFEEGYYDSEGDVIFLESLFSNDTTHNLSPEVIFDHEPKQNESIHNTSITFSPRSDPLHHEFAGEIITLPLRIAREHEEYLSLMTLLYEISTSQSPESFHANPSSIITSPIPVQEEIDIFSSDVIPPDVENDDSEDEDNSTFLPEHESPYLDH
ncbi:hypothetical protein Tco_0623307 [Tanacetum coccineum]